MKLPILPFAFLFCACGFAGLLWVDWNYQLPEHVTPAHRPVTSLTNWGQGKTPSDNVCPPGTSRLTDAETGVFLECMRGTN